MIILLLLILASSVFMILFDSIPIIIITTLVMISLAILSHQPKAYTYLVLTLMCRVLCSISISANPGTDDTLANLDSVAQSSMLFLIFGSLGFVFVILFIFSIKDGLVEFFTNIIGSRRVSSQDGKIKKESLSNSNEVKNYDLITNTDYINWIYSKISSGIMLTTKINESDLSKLDDIEKSNINKLSSLYDQCINYYKKYGYKAYQNGMYNYVFMNYQGIVLQVGKYIGDGSYTYCRKVDSSNSYLYPNYDEMLEKINGNLS